MLNFQSSVFMLAKIRYYVISTIKMLKMKVKFEKDSRFTKEVLSIVKVEKILSILRLNIREKLRKSLIEIEYASTLKCQINWGPDSQGVGKTSKI